MNEKIWIVADKPVNKEIERIISNWEFEGKLIDWDEEKKDFTEGILPESELWLDSMAKKILSEIKEDKNPIVLIYGHLKKGMKSKGYGYFLAERLWCEKIIPVVIAVFDKEITERNYTRRIKDLKDKPILNSGEIKPVLWDILSGKDEFQKSITTSKNILKHKDKFDELSSELTRSILLKQISQNRHSLKNIQSSLRILEGSCLNGWIDKNEAEEIFNQFTDKNPEYANTLKHIKKLTLKLCKEPSGIKVYCNKHLLVCDDELETSACWKAVLETFLKNSLKVSPENALENGNSGWIKNLEDLRKALNEIKKQDRIPPPILLDVKMEEKSVDIDFLKELNENYPLLDVILFTSEKKDGALVRKAYELGYKVFFKELDEERRNTSLYAEKLKNIINDSLLSAPIRALYFYAEKCLPELDEVKSDISRTGKELLACLTLWCQNPELPVPFLISPMLERHLCSYWERNFNDKLPRDNDSNNIIWREVENNLFFKENSNPSNNIGRNAFAEWFDIKFLSQMCRNFITHDLPEEFFEQKDNLSLLGLAIPIIVNICTLYRYEISVKINEDHEWAGIDKLLEALHNDFRLKEFKDILKKLKDKKGKAFKVNDKLLNYIKDKSLQNIKPIEEINKILTAEQPRASFIKRHGKQQYLEEIKWLTIMTGVCILSAYKSNISII